MKSIFYNVAKLVCILFKTFNLVVDKNNIIVKIFND